MFALPYGPLFPSKFQYDSALFDHLLLRHAPSKAYNYSQPASNPTAPPTIVIVPASFTPPSHYSALLSALSRHNLAATVVDLPSTHRRDPLPPATMADDARHIRAVTSQLCEQGKDVVILAHSYGGVPATQSIAGLEHDTRRSQGRSGGVRQIIYLAAIVPAVGSAAAHCFTAGLPDFLQVADEYMSTSAAGAARAIFSDLPLGEGLRRAKQLRCQSAASFMQPLASAGGAGLRVAYVVCEDDALVAPHAQRAFVEGLRAEGRAEVLVYGLRAGHCPNVSQPQSVAELVARIVR